MEKEELQKLFKKYHEGTCTEEEKALLEAWYLEFNEYDLDISPKRIKAIGQRVFQRTTWQSKRIYKSRIESLQWRLPSLACYVHNCA
jgi:hypothetical protein